MQTNHNDMSAAITVSQLNNHVKGLLEASFSIIWIEGEISNFACPSSGHWYFSLKDENAQVRCAMFKGRNSNIKFFPSDGQHVLLRAKATLYPNRGEFQLVVDHIEEAGLGALQRAFEHLKQKLELEGLFDNKYKKIIPKYPQCLGVITSDTGAAIHDILSVLKRRYPILPVIIYPTLVQGSQAAEQITQAIKVANQRNECDVLIVARGGGSLEDLWPFNEEIVARAIFKSEIPIVSGVGHEVDFTIADFVADYRAPTPSAAAEYISPDQKELMQLLDNYESTLQAYIENYFKQLTQQIDWLFRRLKQQHPEKYLQDQKLLLVRLWQSLQLAQSRLLENRQARFKELARALNAVSPLATLDRGYAMAMKDSHLIRSIEQVEINDTIQVTLSQGKLECVIKQIS
jgi:exodeoxyribonuclease VII large subunit